MIGKVLLTLAVIVIVILAVRLIGSFTARAAVKPKPPELEHSRPDADDLEWDEASKSYKPRQQRDDEPR